MPHATQNEHTGLPGIRWVIIWMCFLANCISFVDRANLAIATPMIQQDLGLNAGQMGLVLSAFFWTYAVMQLPAGLFIDRVGVRIGLIVAVGWWSLFTALTSLARNSLQLVAARVALGIGEAAALPSFTKVASIWFPRHERGLACSIFNSGSTAGAALSLPLITWLIAATGWRGAFVATGALGIFWALGWLLIYRDPRRLRGVTAVTPPTAARSSAAARWKDLFRYRSVWGLMIGLFCLNFAIYFFITWFPSYLMQARGFSLMKLGTLGMLPPLMGIVGSWLGGHVSDSLVRKGWTPTRARKTCLVAGMTLASSISLAAVVESASVCLLLFSLAYACLSFTGANAWTVVSEIAPTPDHVASLGGIQNFAGNLAGIVITTFTGMMLTLTSGSFLIPLATAGAMCVLGAASYLFLLGDVEPLSPWPLQHR